MKPLVTAPPLIPNCVPRFGQREREYVLRCLDSGFLVTGGQFVPQFERRFADYVGARFAVATSSGTAALHVSMRLLDLEEEDEVIVPALTFVATANAVRYVGATPVFADIDPQTWTLDPGDVRRKLSSRTKAIVPVHLYGNPADLDAILDLAQEFDLAVIEDATEGLGARYRRRRVGTFGRVGCFSFNANKLITAAGGGMLVTDEEDLARRARSLVNQAQAPGREYFHTEVGYNYRLMEVQAAVGLAQLEQIDAFLAAKRSHASRWKALLELASGLAFQRETQGAESAWWLFCVLLENQTGRERLAQHLRGKGIEARPAFVPIPLLGPFGGARNAGRHLTAESVSSRALCLPSSAHLTDQEIDFTVSCIRELHR